MNGLAALLALALAQDPQAAPEKAAPAPPEETPEPARPAPADLPGREPADAPGAPVESPAPRPAPSPKPPAAAPAAEGAAPAPAPARPSRPPQPAVQKAAPRTVAPDAEQPARPEAAPPATTGRPEPAGSAASAASPERTQVAGAAARFFQALLARRAADLAALSSPSFSFDGRPARGAEEVRARWQEAVVRRDGATYALLDLEVLPAADAVARFGKPPRRVAGLLQPGTWVAAANLSGRPTFVFFARQGGAWLATGMHD